MFNQSILSELCRVKRISAMQLPNGRVFSEIFDRNHALVLH